MNWSGGALTLLACVAAAPVQAQSSKQGPPPTEEQLVAVAIERTLQKHGPEVHRCFERALADRLDVAGKVEVEVEVAAGGKVANSKIVSRAEDVSPQLSACVLDSASRWVVEGVEVGASLVLPFGFQGQINQFIIKTADVPERGPPAAKGRGGVKIQPPFMVKILADEANVRAQRASLTLLTVGPASRVAMHRHPRSAKLLYVLRGHARLLGPPGVAPERLDEGTAMFLPAGYPHAIENMGRQADAVFLQAFNPPGPERVYRDPTDSAARADFEVIRDPTKVRAPASDAPGSRPVVGTLAKVKVQAFLGGKASGRVVMDQSVTGSTAFGLRVVEFAAGAQIPGDSHRGSEQFLYVLSGGGTLTVGSESMPFGADQTIHIPLNQPYAVSFGTAGSADPTVVIDMHVPTGPEQPQKAK